MNGFRNYTVRSIPRVLILSNEDASRVLTMPDCIAALEVAYRDAARGVTINGRRSDMIAATEHPDAVYCLKMVGGVVPAQSIGALRLNSDILSFPVTNGVRRKVKVPAAPGNRWVGLVILFSTATGEPLAIFPDGVVQRMRVGGTSGLAVKYLAKPDAAVVAILGTGWQAGAQAMAAAAVRPLTELRCFSPNPESRAAFAAEYSRELGLPVIPAVSAEAAVDGADIVLCATNSLGPVFDARWLRKGMHIGSIRDRELPPAAIAAADCIFIHDPENMGSDHVVTASNVSYSEQTKEVRSDPALARVATALAITALVSGSAPGRASPDDVTCFLNYHGVGYQFAAVGAVFYEKAKALGLGTSLPSEWFTETVHP